MPAFSPGLASALPTKRMRVELLSLSTKKMSLFPPSSTAMKARLTCPEILTSSAIADAPKAISAVPAAMASTALPVCMKFPQLSFVDVVRPLSTMRPS
jgi:hypothetical protein